MSCSDSNSDYNIWMTENYPNYAKLEQFSKMRAFYLDLPAESANTGSDVDSVQEGSSACVPSFSEAGTFSSEDVNASSSARSFLMFGIDEDDHDPLGLAELDSYYAESALPSEGTIPISLWFDDSETPDTESEYEIETPVDEEPDYVRELRESLHRVLPSHYDDPLMSMVFDSLAPLDDDLIDAPVDCFADVCWASQQKTVELPQIIIHPSIDVPEEAQQPDEEPYATLSPTLSPTFIPFDDIACSPPPRRPKSPTGFKRFAQRFRLDSFGRSNKRVIV